MTKQQHQKGQEIKQQLGMGYEQQNGSQNPSTRARTVKKLRHYVRRLLDRVDALRSCLFHPDVWQHGHRVALDGGASGAAAKSQVVWNPIIYVGTNKKFRMAFYQSLPCTRLRYWFEVREEEIVSEDTKPDDTPGQSALRASQQSASTVIPPATNKVDTTIVCTTDV